MNYHDRMKNIQVDRDKLAVGVAAAIDRDRYGYGHLSYRYGHQDTRQDAAKIALEADGEIERLKERIAPFKENYKQLLHRAIKIYVGHDSPRSPVVDAFYKELMFLAELEKD